MSEPRRQSAAIESIVDRFISETFGICDPAPYRQAMIEHFGLAIDFAKATSRSDERERCAKIADAVAMTAVTTGYRNAALLIAERIRSRQ